MTVDANRLRRFPLFRLVLAAAWALTALALLPLTISTLALVVPVLTDCQLGAAVGDSCRFAGANMRPFLTAAVSMLQWSEPAWSMGTIAVLLWMGIFVRGIACDIRFVRDPQLPGATSGWRRAYLLIPLTGATIVAFAPILSVIWAALFSGAFGCTVNEGASHPCVVAGVDYGDALYQSFVAGWLMLIVWPLVLIVLVGWIGVAGYAIGRRIRRA
jgi:hypothetical protein